MIIQCAWCDEVIGKKRGKGISHGICPECLKKMNKKMSREASMAAHSEIEQALQREKNKNKRSAENE